MESFVDWAMTLPHPPEMEDNRFVFGQQLTIYWVPFASVSQFDHPLEPNMLVLWEDVWHCKTALVKSRILSLLGMNNKIAAKETAVVKLDKPRLGLFLTENHLMGSVSCKFKLGLSYHGILVAVASFSAPKTYYREDGEYRSVELLRYASQAGLNVVGGLGKLLNHFIQEQQPDDVMTYADREWSDGTVYEGLGFELVGFTPALPFLIDKVTLQRHYEPRMQQDGLRTEEQYVRIRNLGNRKYLLKIKK
jgi:hypothetical protein